MRPVTFLMITVVLGSVIPPSTHGQDCVAYDEVARWVGGRRLEGYVFDVVRIGDVAFMHNIAGLLVYDLEDPVRPVELTVLPYGNGEMAVADGVLVCSDPDGTVIYDVRDARNPVLIWRDDDPVWASVALDDGRFYQRFDDQLEAYSVTPGQPPVFLGSTACGGDWRLTVRDGVAFYRENSGLRCVDVSDPENMTVRGFLDVEGYLKRIAFCGDHVVTTSVANVSGGTLSVVDFNDLDNLQIVATSSLGSGWVSGLAVDGETVIVTSGNDLMNSGLVYVDLSDPYAPVWLGRLDSAYAPHAVECSAPGRTTVGMDEGFAVFDHLALEFVHELDYEWAPADAWGVALRGDFLYMTTEEGWVTWDVSDPLDAEVVYESNHVNDMRAMADAGDLIYVGTQSGYVTGYAVSGAQAPVSVESYAAPGPVQSLTVNESLLGVACGTAGAAIFARGEQAPLAEIDQVVEWGNVLSDVRDVAFAGPSTVVIADDQYGVLVFELDGDGLSLRSNHRELAPVSSVVVRDGHIYAAGGSQNWSPVRPTQLSTLALHADGWTEVLDVQQLPVGTCNLKFAGDYLYVGMLEFGVFAYEFVDSSIPALLGGAATRAPTGTWMVRDFCVGPDHVFVADDGGGLRVLAAHCDNLPESATAVTKPTVASRISAAPNPFNPSTTFRYELSVDATVRMQIFDPRGRVVRTLVNEELPAGLHESIWAGVDDAGRNVSSGAYICRLQTGKRVDTTRVVLLK